MACRGAHRATPPESAARPQGRVSRARTKQKRPSLEVTVSRVLFSALPRRGVILLGRSLPTGSSDRLEIGSTRATPAGLPPRSRTGLAPGGVCRAPLVTERAVRSYRTVSPLPPAETGGGLFSVALSFESPRLAVSQHLALWSPDFPRRDLTISPRPTPSPPARGGRSIAESPEFPAHLVRGARIRSTKKRAQPLEEAAGDLGVAAGASAAGSFIRSSQ